MTDDKTQQETITWHKYPDEKPDNGTDCIATLDGNSNFRVCFVTFDCGEFEYFNEDIVAWGKQPEGWKERNDGACPE